jgi:hypothetical protein
MSLRYFAPPVSPPPERSSPQRRRKPSRVAKFVSNGCSLALPAAPPSPACHIEPTDAPRSHPVRLVAPTDEDVRIESADAGAEVGASHQEPIARRLPLLYNIVSRGRMPGIVFHNDAVELLYPRQQDVF